MERTKVKIAFLSTYPPRECGLAMFTKSFMKIFDELYVKRQAKVIAVSDEKGKYVYSPRVMYEIDQFDRQSYIEAANIINQSPIEVVCLQHEYGIFGGQDGDYILNFLETVNRPVVTSLHSVVRRHNKHRYDLTQRILDLSSSVVVMTKDAKKMLNETFKVDLGKIKIVPHGVPNIRYDEKNTTKELLWLKEKKVLSTFGLINPGKGIETVIKALPKVIKKFPDIVYLIIGATHPTILKQEGEKYRQGLVDLAKKLNLEGYVKFINRYLEYEELVYFLKATDIYLAPQLDFNQAFSGTISYAIGCGCAVISSPTNYAKEILASNRGIISPPEPDRLAHEISWLLSSEENLKKIALNGYRLSRSMIWPSVGIEYLKVIESNLFTENSKWKSRLPNFIKPPSLQHMEAMTDQSGIIQHARLDIPDIKFGYSLDDQARALIVCRKYLDHFSKKESQVRRLLNIYLNFLKKAIDKNKIPHNFFNKKKKFTDQVASDDSIARSFWALSYLASSKKITEKTRQKIKKILSIYKKNLKFREVKPTAFALLGAYQLKNKSLSIKIADDLVERFRENTQKEIWEWFENELTWGNAIVPYSLLKAYELTNKNDYFKIAIQSARFLEKNYREGGVPSPIGQNGWYYRGKKKAIFDQQPIEAADMVILYNELFRISKEKKYQQMAYEWMGWYFGNNIKQAMVYDNITKGVFDGVTKGGVSLNRGAESIITYLMAYLSFHGGL